MNTELCEYVERLNNGIWRNKCGNDIKIEDMTTPHIEQCIGYLRRRDRQGSPWYLSAVWIKLFQFELLKRKQQ